jgi:hypothetical protein
VTRDDELRAAATELYAGPLADFVRARNARAKGAATPDVATAIKALRKPSMAAWVVNVFAQERADELGEALQLADELREAQADLDAAALAKLGKERRALTHRLAERAGELAVARGERVTPATLGAVQQTISAAFFDEDASLAVASGRLVRELEPSAGVDLDDAIAGGAPSSAAGTTDEPMDELAARRRRRQAERTVREAQDAVAAAERAHDTAKTDARNASRRLDEIASAAADLEKQLAHLRRERERTQDAADAAEKRISAASGDIEEAERSLGAAQKALDSL